MTSAHGGCTANQTRWAFPAEERKVRERPERRHCVEPDNPAPHTVIVDLRDVVVLVRPGRTDGRRVSEEHEVANHDLRGRNRHAVSLEAAVLDAALDVQAV